MKIGIVGAGVGGLALALGIVRAGGQVVVLEQARAFGQVGADVNLTPNSTKALDGLAVGEAVRGSAARPTRRLSRHWRTGEITSDLPMSDEAEHKYGAPQLTVHRAALLSALLDPLPAGTVRLGRRVVDLDDDGSGVTLTFSDDTCERVDVLVGADGIHSQVRTCLFGAQAPEYTGLVAYRAVVPVERLSGIANLDAFTKWWGPDPSTQIVTFPLNRTKDVFIFATVSQPELDQESWTQHGRAAEFRHHYEGFHADARGLLDACDEVMKSALCVRDPMPEWGRGRVTLLGDACHAMTPFMAQGAGQAIEDGVVLARALTEADPGIGAHVRLRTYEQARRDRTARVQLGSRGNEWLKDGGDADWVYGYDAWQEPLPWPASATTTGPGESGAGPGVEHQLPRK